MTNDVTEEQKKECVDTIRNALMKHLPEFSVIDIKVIDKVTEEDLQLAMKKVNIARDHYEKIDPVSPTYEDERKDAYANYMFYDGRLKALQTVYRKEQENG